MPLVLPLPPLPPLVLLVLLALVLVLALVVVLLRATRVCQPQWPATRRLFRRCGSSTKEDAI